MGKRIRKWYSFGLPVFLALALTVSPVRAAETTDDTEVFDGWSDEKRDDALMMLETTDWEVFADQLIMDDKVRAGMQAKDLSKQVQALEQTVKSALSTCKSRTAVSPKRYAPLILAMIQVMSDGKPSKTDPCCVTTYFSKEAVISSPESSVRFLFNRIQDMELAYNSSSIHKKKVNMEKDGDGVAIVIESVMLREGYAKGYTKYSAANAAKYYEDNKAVLFEPYGIVPIMRFSEKVKKHITYVNYAEGTTIVWNGNITPAMQKVCDSARNGKSTRAARSGYCAAWVSGVYEYALGYYPGGNAIDYWRSWSSTGSRDSGNIPPGAAVVGTGSGTQYGHVGIYVGNGEVAENIGGYRVVSLERWIASQNRGKSGISGEQGWIGWVWPAKKNLSKA